MINGIIFAIISKEEGRKYIMKTPMNKFQAMIQKSYYPSGGAKRYKKLYHYEKIGNLQVIVNSHLALLSLFNDCCAICGKPFTHYAIAKTLNSNLLRLVPIAFDNLGMIIDYNIDHIMPKSKDGSNLLCNLQLTCFSENCKKSDIVNSYVQKYGVKKGCLNVSE